MLDVATAGISNDDFRPLGETEMSSFERLLPLLLTDTVSDLPGLAGADEAFRLDSLLLRNILVCPGDERTDSLPCSDSNFILAESRTSFNVNDCRERLLFSVGDSITEPPVDLLVLFTPLESLILINLKHNEKENNYSKLFTKNLFKNGLCIVKLIS